MSHCGFVSRVVPKLVTKQMSSFVRTDLLERARMRNYGCANGCPTEKKCCPSQIQLRVRVRGDDEKAAATSGSGTLFAQGRKAKHEQMKSASSEARDDLC